MKKNHRKTNKTFVRSYLSIAVWLVFAVPGVSSAVPIVTSDPDLAIRWDNTIRYNIGVRGEKQDRTLADTWALQAGEYKFAERGTVNTNRIDVLSELDVVFKEKFGGRLSAVLWNDFAYNDKVIGNPAYAALGPIATAYPGNRYTPAVSRYYTKSAEWMDAFVFGEFEVAGRPLNLKLGRHTVYWGESLFSPIHGVSYSQGPIDFRKALATPGVEAKEVFLPLNQFSFQSQVTDKLSIMGQYFLEWKPYRIYEGGTYFTYADPFFQGGTNYLGIPFTGNQRAGAFKQPDDRGSWGLATKWSPDWIGGTVGAYYRKFDDKVMSIIEPDGPGTALINAYAKGVKIVGVSLSKSVLGTSVGVELSHRQNGVLNTGFGAPGLAIGDSWHLVVNDVAYLGKNPVFDSATLLAELTYSKLDKVRSGRGNFWHVGDWCPTSPLNNAGGTKTNGCATDDAVGIAMNFEPKWFQAFQGIDVTLPIHYDIGLKGNSPVPFGGNVKSGSWSVGVSADYQNKYSFKLAWTDYLGTYSAGPNLFAGMPGLGATQMYTSNGGNALIRDRGWLSATFKTTF